MSEVGRMDSEKHSLVLKEVLTLISKYPHLLTLAVINKVSSLDEGGATLATKTCIQELKNEFNHQVKAGLGSSSNLDRQRIILTLRYNLLLDTFITLESLRCFILVFRELRCTPGL